MCGSLDVPYNVGMRLTSASRVETCNWEDQEYAVYKRAAEMEREFIRERPGRPSRG